MCSLRVRSAHRLGLLCVIDRNRPKRHRVEHLLPVMPGSPSFEEAVEEPEAANHGLGEGLSGSLSLAEALLHSRRYVACDAQAPFAPPTVSAARRALEAAGSTGLGHRTPLLRQGYGVRGVQRAHPHSARSLKVTALHYSFSPQRPLHRNSRVPHPQTRRIQGVGCRERLRGSVGGKLTTYHLIGGASRALRASQSLGSARFASLHRRACWFSVSRPSNWGCRCFAAMTSAASFLYTKG